MAEKRVPSTVKHNAAKRASGLSSKRSSLATVHRQQVGKMHAHFCSDRDCRMYYEDSCDTPERNARCQVCNGVTRTWVDRESGTHAHDPRECCIDNTTLITNNDLLERHDLAGPGPWFQCNTCARAHGWSCSTGGGIE